nr:hypothetical protein [Tanacetum cinerariifolium]
MADHKQKMEAETNAEKQNEWVQKMEIWKHALTQVANLKGKEPKNISWLQDGSENTADIITILDRDFTETILKACNINTRSGITHLIDRCLLHIDRDDVLSMHSLIQEMGRDEGKGNLLGLSLDMRMLEKEKLRGSSELQTLTGSCSKAKRLLGSLKILDLSFSEQLSGVGGFCELPSLESLFLSNCPNLIEICESIDHCDELVFIDLSNCKDLGELPRTLAKLKKVKTLLLDGCNKGELAVVEAVQRDFKTSAVYFPSSLVMLSLAKNNLSNESFPMDLSCLSMLKELCLDGNPIVSMPDCVRTLPRLKMLFMRECVMLGSIEHPPRTLLSLRINGRHMSCIRKISFDQEMSPLDLQTTFSLGWSNLEFLNKRRVGTYQYGRVPEGSRTQMYYEFGIFSTVYGGKVMPTWITCRTKGPSISFTIPSSPNKLRGLNLCYVQTLIRPYRRSRLENGNSEYQLINLPYIKLRNITKNLTWLYTHYLVRVNVGGKSLTFLSHWMFGENEMEDGDQLTFSIKHRKMHKGLVDTRECGVSFVYDDGKNEKEEDPLSYYKSWNHIIGGDLSPYQSTTQEYNLNHHQLVWGYYPFFTHGILYKEPLFKAFSPKNSNTRGRAIEDVSK